MSDIKDFVIKDGVLKMYKGKGGDVVIPDSVTSIDKRAFANCTSLTSVTIPENVTSIGNNAFENCESLIKVTIPKNVTSIGYSVFENTPYYNDEENWENGVLYNNNHLIKAKRFILGEYRIKEGTKTIASEAFCSCRGLRNIIIPESVTKISEGAFELCDRLRNIIIPKSVTSIGDKAFSWCCSLASITIPDSVTSIGYSAFEMCRSLTSITIPDSVTSIDQCAFDDCYSLKSIKLPESITSISNHMFSDCINLTSITIPDSVTSIGKYAFARCKRLKSVAIPDSVKNIGEYAFLSCESLTNITIPESITNVGWGIFEGCDMLSDLVVESDNFSIYANTFGKKLPKGLVPQIPSLYKYMKDGAVKNYILNTNIWDDLDIEIKVDLFMTKNSKSLLTSYSQCVSEADAKEIAQRIPTYLSKKASVKECNTVASFMTAFHNIVANEQLKILYNFLKNQKNGKKALATIEAEPDLLNKLNS